jgi:hypothetical protein
VVKRITAQRVPHGENVLGGSNHYCCHPDCCFCGIGNSDVGQVHWELTLYTVERCEIRGKLLDLLTKEKIVLAFNERRYSDGDEFKGEGDGCFE